MKYLLATFNAWKHRQAVETSRTCMGLATQGIGKADLAEPQGPERAGGPSESAKAQGANSRTARRFLRRAQHTAAALACPVAVCAFSAAPAFAQSAFLTVRCGDRDQITERLQLTYTEIQIGIGLVDGSHIIELWASDETGTWTILRTDNNDVSCVLATGSVWMGSTPRLPIEGDPT